jgi:hypothetical protein
LRREVPMKRKQPTADDAVKTLRAAALGHPGAEEGIACQGTALESSAFKARNKTFLFMGRSDARLKLAASRAEAQELAEKDPAHYRVGALGWITIKWSDDTPLPVELLTRWIEESYRTVVGAK